MFLVLVRLIQSGQRHERRPKSRTYPRKCIPFIRGKVREFCGWPGKFRKDWESQGKVKNLKINGYGTQSSENVFTLFKWGRDVLSREIVSAHLPSHSLIGVYS